MVNGVHTVTAPMAIAQVAAGYGRRAGVVAGNSGLHRLRLTRPQIVEAVRLLSDDPGGEQHAAHRGRTDRPMLSCDGDSLLARLEGTQEAAQRAGQIIACLLIQVVQQLLLQLNETSQGIVDARPPDLRQTDRNRASVIGSG